MYIGEINTKFKVNIIKRIEHILFQAWPLKLLDNMYDDTCGLYIVQYSIYYLPDAMPILYIFYSYIISYPMCWEGKFYIQLQNRTYEKDRNNYHLIYHNNSHFTDLILVH